MVSSGVVSSGVVTSEEVSSGVVCTVTIGVVISSLLGESDSNMLTPTIVPVVATAAVVAMAIHVLTLTPFKTVIALCISVFELVAIVFRPVLNASKLIFFITIHFHVSPRRDLCHILYHIFLILSMFLHILVYIQQKIRAPTL